MGCGEGKVKNKVTVEKKGKPQNNAKLKYTYQ